VLLERWQGGDEAALAALTPMVYAELHQLARSAFRQEGRKLTLQPTALIHEAYLQLVDASVDWQNRSHFYCLAARMMRRILVNHAQARGSQKRGGNALHVTLHEDDVAQPDAAIDVLALDSALDQLTQRSSSDADIVSLHYFGGLTYGEIGLELGVSEATVKRRLRFAKAWLGRHIANDGSDAP
jgi:RNA polymerase sigma factor (TIGR02999 family)